MPPTLQRFDHIHVYVADRAAAERWYHEVLGLVRVPRLEFWAADGGPLTLADASDTIHLALFERSTRPCRSTVAFAVSVAEFTAWREHLSTVLGQPMQVEDHALAWSLYFTDPDGNPYEITSYDYETLASQLAPGDR